MKTKNSHKIFALLLAVIIVFMALPGFAVGDNLVFGELKFNLLTDDWSANGHKLTGASYGNSYYEQLDNFERHVYNARMESVDLMREGEVESIEFDVTEERTIEEFGDAVFNALMAFDYDNPHIFWLNKQMRIGYRYNPDTNIVAEGCFMIPEEGWYNTSYTSEAEVIAAEAEFDAKVTELVSQAVGTIYDKAIFFHDWLVNNNSYNSSVLDGDIEGADQLAWSAASALIGNPDSTLDDPVCEGYSRAFKVLCDACDIPCAIITGDAGEAHMWNYVKIHNGLWFAVDVTWDDPVSSMPTLTHRYFLKGSDSFLGDHTEDGCVAGYGTFIYPVLCSNDYPLELRGALGDVNENGGVDTGDAATVLRHAVQMAEIPEELILHADFNCDGIVNTGDAALLLAAAVLG